MLSFVPLETAKHFADTQEANISSKTQLTSEMADLVSEKTSRVDVARQEILDYEEYSMILDIYRRFMESAKGVEEEQFAHYCDKYEENDITTSDGLKTFVKTYARIQQSGLFDRLKSFDEFTNFIRKASVSIFDSSFILSESYRFGMKDEQKRKVYDCFVTLSEMTWISKEFLAKVFFGKTSDEIHSEITEFIFGKIGGLGSTDPMVKDTLTRLSNAIFDIEIEEIILMGIGKVSFRNLIERMNKAQEREYTGVDDLIQQRDASKNLTEKLFEKKEAKQAFKKIGIKSIDDIADMDPSAVSTILTKYRPDLTGQTKRTAIRAIYSDLFGDLVVRIKDSRITKFLMALATQIYESCNMDDDLIAEEVLRLREQIKEVITPKLPDSISDNLLVKILRAGEFKEPVIKRIRIILAKRQTKTRRKNRRQRRRR